jgi:hypothetical protein
MNGCPMKRFIILHKNICIFFNQLPIIHIQLPIYLHTHSLHKYQSRIKQHPKSICSRMSKRFINLSMNIFNEDMNLFQAGRADGLYPSITGQRLVP